MSQKGVVDDCAEGGGGGEKSEHGKRSGRVVRRVVSKAMDIRADGRWILD